MAAAARMLAEARFPVIIAGGGVVQGNAGEDLEALAEHLTSPVVNSYLHQDSFPWSHELGVGPLGYQGSKAAMSLIAQADVVLALGSRLGPFGTLPQYGITYWPEEAEIIQVDVDHRVLGLSRRVALAIDGDARATARELLARLRVIEPSRARNEKRIGKIAAAKAEWIRELDSLSSRVGEPMSPRHALAVVRDAIPEETIVTTDIGNISSVANSYVRPSRPRQFLAAMTFGNCGYSYPAALGAQLAAPDAPVLAHVGDGAWGMSLAETMTAVREDIPVVAVVWDNAQWGAEKRNQVDFYGHRFVATNLANPDFAAVATAMGAVGIRVEKEAELSDAVREALAGRRPTVIDLVVDSEELAEPFRRDALKPPVRLLSKYSHLAAR